jgi:uncharacterized SAM-binding protein YcdF (DUF218 family)
LACEAFPPNTMFFYLGKLAGNLFGPLGLAIILVITALCLFRKARLARILAISGVAILWLFSTRLVSQALLRGLESQIPGYTVEGAPQEPVIVVLGGFMRTPYGAHKYGEFKDAGDRLVHAFRLYRAGKAPLILISAGDVPIFGKGDETEAEAARAILLEWGVPDAAILVEKRSKSTAENARFSRELLAARGIKRALLVTSASHMPRAVGVFRKAGLDVSPSPADHLAGWAEPDLPFRILPDSRALDESTLALHEYIGLLIYRLRGWI